MKPRYEPSWGDMEEYQDEFWGQIGELDVWANNTDNPDRYLYIVGPDSRKRGRFGANFDSFMVEGAHLIPEEPTDLNITPYELGRLYEMAMEKGLIQ